MTPESAFFWSAIANVAIDLAVIIIIAAILAGGEGVVSQEIASLKNQLVQERIKRRELELSMTQKVCDIMDQVDEIDNRFKIDQNKGTITFYTRKVES